MPAPKWVHDLFDLLPADKQQELLEAMELRVRFLPWETFPERLKEAKARLEKPLEAGQD